MSTTIAFPAPDEVKWVLPLQSFHQITAIVFMNGKATEADIQEAIPNHIRTHSEHGPAATKELEEAAANLISTWLKEKLHPFIIREYKHILTNGASKDNSFFDALNTGSFKTFRKWWELRFFGFETFGRRRMSHLLTIFKSGVPIEYILQADLRKIKISEDENIERKRKVMIELQGWCSMLLSSACANIVLDTQKVTGFMENDPDWEVVTEKLGNVRDSCLKFKLTWKDLPDPVQEAKMAEVEMRAQMEKENKTKAEQEQTPKKKRKVYSKFVAAVKARVGLGGASASASSNSNSTGTVHLI